MKELADVIALIEKRELTAGFADQLDPYVRDCYLELWNEVQQAPPDQDQQ